MLKITIELDPSASASGQTVRVEGPAAAAPASQPDAISPPPELAAQAARIGAINAGPAPALGAVGPAIPPIATSIGGGHLDSHQDAISAGEARR